MTTEPKESEILEVLKGVKNTFFEQRRVGFFGVVTFCQLAYCVDTPAQRSPERARVTLRLSGVSLHFKSSNHNHKLKTLLPSPFSF